MIWKCNNSLIYGLTSTVISVYVVLIYEYSCLGVFVNPGRDAQLTLEVIEISSRDQKA